MKSTFLLICALWFALTLAGCWEGNVCSSSEDCADFKCEEACPHKKLCVSGRCECECIEEGNGCATDIDCEKIMDCGLPPNKSACVNGNCRCEYRCETEADCSGFECLIECYPNYNYCQGGACTCGCEQEQEELQPWKANELKEDLEGKIITVSGTARVSQEKKCSEEECEGECCHECSAALELHSDNSEKAGSIALGGRYKGREVNCKGSECGMECWPLEIENTYSVQGMWSLSAGQYYLEPLKFALSEKGKPRFSSNKAEYAQGETVKFSLEFARDIFFRSWEPHSVHIKNNGEWVEYSTKCGCVPDCNSTSPACEENFPECAPQTACSKAGRGVAWQWNLKYCESMEIDCTWQAGGMSEKVYCGNTTDAGPGTYKIAFTYFDGCEPTQEKLTAYSNEFRIE